MTAPPCPATGNPCELLAELADAKAAIRSLEATEELLRERLRGAGQVYRIMVRRERQCQRVLGRQRAAELRELLEETPGPSPNRTNSQQ